MNLIREKLSLSAVHARVFPFFVFLFLTSGALLGGDTKFWLYFAKVFLGLWMVWEMRAFVPEMRWAVSWEAIVVGLLVFVIWVGLDPYYPRNTLFFKDTEDSIW